METLKERAQRLQVAGGPWSLGRLAAAFEFEQRRFRLFRLLLLVVVEKDAQRRAQRRRLCRRLRPGISQKLAEPMLALQ